MTPDGQLSEHQVLSKQWLAMVRQVEDIRTKLHALGPTKQTVPPEMLAQIAILQNEETALLQGEIDPTIKKYYDLAVVETRQQIYGSDVTTKQQAIDEFDRRQRLGKTPQRQTADGKQPAPPIPIVPGVQSTSPAVHPALSVARAR